MKLVNKTSLASFVCAQIVQNDLFSNSTASGCLVKNEI
jgi:hypothetical protein